MIERALGEEKLRLPSPSKSGRGKKECPECGCFNAAASKDCLCGYKFYITKKPKKSKKYKEINWKDLHSGDLIYIESSDIWINPDGESIPMGETGEFLVKKVRHDGLVLYNSRHGYSFQDMINTGYNVKTGITRGEAKIYKKI